jgi:undecaprenyl-diphosphatase
MGESSMHFHFWIKSLVMGIVEGITEFLPVSSTGHLILAGELLNFPDPGNRNIYEIFIQLGAVLAVVWEYRVKILNMLASALRWGADRDVLLGNFVAFVPSAAIGLLLGDEIKNYFFSPSPVAFAFITGGGIILWAEKRKSNARINSVDEVHLRDALLVGLSQCLALIPGTSRSGATIIGGMLAGLSRSAATEFSFLLGIPTLGIAALYSLYSLRHELSPTDVGIFTVGLIASFLSALIVIRALLRFVGSHALNGFGWYRIAFGLIVLATGWTGVVSWSI